MAISHAQRVQMYNGLCKELTVDVANTLMEHLPPDGWSEVAMKSDVAELRAETKVEFASVRAEISELRAETKVEFASVRADISVLRAETNMQFAEVRADISVLRAEMKNLGATFNETLATAIAKQNKWMLGLMTSLVVTMFVSLVR